MAYDINCGAAYNGRPTYELHLYVRSNSVSGNSASYAWELYMQRNSGTAWSSNPTPWEVNIGGQIWRGSSAQDFRNGQTHITIASSTTQYFGHDANGDLNLLVQAGHSGDSPIGGASLSCWFATDRIATVPPKTTPLSLDVLSSTSMQYRFSGNGNGGSAITAWQYQYDTESSFSGAAVRNGDGTEVVTGLTPGTKYYFRSRGVNAVGAGAWSSALSAMTWGGGRVRLSDGTWDNARVFIRLSDGTWDDAIGFVNAGGNTWYSID